MKWLKLLSDPKVRAFVADALEIYAELVRGELDEEAALGRLIAAFHEHWG